MFTPVSLTYYKDGPTVGYVIDCALHGICSDTKKNIQKLEATACGCVFVIRFVLFTPF